MIVKLEMDIPVFEAMERFESWLITERWIMVNLAKSWLNMVPVIRCNTASEFIRFTQIPIELKKNISQQTTIVPFLLIHIYIHMYIRLVSIRNH